MEVDSVIGGQLLSRAEAATWVAAQRACGRTVVFTNGVFDLLHRGHVEYLQRARALGDTLVVGLNDDSSVRAIKGPERPIQGEEDRSAVLAALRAVDVVVIFHEPTAEALVAAIQPDIYVKGGDWGPEQRTPPEAAVALSYGGRVEYLPYLSGHSTSGIVAHIRS